MADEQKSPQPVSSDLSKEKGDEASSEDENFLETVMKSMGDMPNEEKIRLLEQKYKSLYRDLKSVEKKLIRLERELLQHNIVNSSSSDSLESKEGNKQGRSYAHETNVSCSLIPGSDHDYIETINAELTKHQPGEFLGTDKTDGDGSDSQIETSVNIPPTESGSIEDSESIDQAAFSSDISIKEARSVPITKTDHEEISYGGSLEKPQSSGDLHEDLSVGDLPLYKSSAVTDVPIQGGHPTLVKESEGRTNIWEPSSPTQ